MTIVTLRPPLRDLAGGSAQVDLEGSTVLEVLRALESEHPKTVGWILDDQGRIRRHVNVFVNGEMTREDAPLQPGDRLHVIPSITGGSP
jgi:molybdopterin synthase sulfur carrier subunit